MRGGGRRLPHAISCELRRDAFTLNQQTNTLGTFTFNSLAELEAQQPSSFSRQLAPKIRSGSQYVGGISLGVEWGWQAQIIAFAIFSIAAIPAWRRLSRSVEAPVDRPFLGGGHGDVLPGRAAGNRRLLLGG